MRPLARSGQKALVPLALGLVVAYGLIEHLSLKHRLSFYLHLVAYLPKDQRMGGKGEDTQRAPE